eukprot:4860405-Prymnesium_polylepis.2
MGQRRTLGKLWSERISTVVRTNCTRDGGQKVPSIRISCGFNVNPPEPLKSAKCSVSGRSTLLMLRATLCALSAAGCNARSIGCNK